MSTPQLILPASNKKKRTNKQTKQKKNTIHIAYRRQEETNKQTNKTNGWEQKEQRCE